MTKRKDCYCSGYTRADGSPILCMNCNQRELIKTLEAATKRFSNTKIINLFFEEIAYEDYDFSENDGYVDHEATVCKLCSTGMRNRGECLKHFYEQHWTKPPVDNDMPHVV